MGLRRVFSRRRSSDEGARADDAAPGFRHQADPATGRLIEQDVPTTGGLVVGAATLRHPPVDVPEVFAAPPRPAPRPAETSNAPGQGSPGEGAEPFDTSAETRPFDRELVRKAWDGVAERADLLVRNFYAELYVGLGAEALQMFPSSMAAQREDFGRTLVQWVVADDPEAMTSHLDQLGADHRKFEVEPHHYEIAGQALVNAWSRLAGADWTRDVEDAVVGSYTRLASIMIDGALRRRDEPASWGATVIGHERIVSDFAVLTIQPDAPYMYRPGQYLTVESEQHPKQWRQMSIASAPRADNTFDLHVRSVGSSGVSAALVAHTGVGDRLRLGAPRGNDLVIEPGTASGGVLCVCSGVGSAPISAVVESMLTWPECPPLYAFVGVRTSGDLYPVDQLNRLAYKGARDGRVSVHGVVSDEPDYRGYRGRVEQVVPALRDWARLGVEVLVAGPDAMIATTVVGLTDRGVPIERIHFDQYDTTAA